MTTPTGADPFVDFLAGALSLARRSRTLIEGLTMSEPIESDLSAITSPETLFLLGVLSAGARIEAAFALTPIPDAGPTSEPRPPSPRGSLLR